MEPLEKTKTDKRKVKASSPEGQKLINKKAEEEEKAWSAALLKLAQERSQHQFAIGDLLAAGETTGLYIKRGLYKEAHRITGIPIGTLSIWKMVSSRIPESFRRINELSFSHHMEIAGYLGKRKPEPFFKRVMDHAIEKELSLTDFRMYLDKVTGKKKATPAVIPVSKELEHQAAVILNIQDKVTKLHRTRVGGKKLTPEQVREYYAIKAQILDLENKLGVLKKAISEMAEPNAKEIQEYEATMNIIKPEAGNVVQDVAA